MLQAEQKAALGGETELHPGDRGHKEQHSSPKQPQQPENCRTPNTDTALSKPRVRAWKSVAVMEAAPQPNETWGLLSSEWGAQTAP